MTSCSEYHDAVVIGGGFYGCRIALELARGARSVILLEQGDALIGRASYANQARVHNGYHYPRSILTALRSRLNFPRFVADYPECIDNSFDAYYAIAKRFSNVTASQFRVFCDRIGAPLEPADRDIKALFNPALVEDVFRVKEYAFDAVKLRARMIYDLAKGGVAVQVRRTVEHVKSLSDGSIQLVVRDAAGARETITTSQAFNCTYASLNHILRASQLPLIPLKHELVEMPLIELPAPLSRVGITIMCGPFFSVWPFPSQGMHTLHHVRYTVHCWWRDREDEATPAVHVEENRARSTHYEHMLRDMMRYIPLLTHCRYKGSLWALKTVLPQSEVDDSRPILFRRDHGLKNFTCVLGAKIDNIYDVLEELGASSHHELSGVAGKLAGTR